MGGTLSIHLRQSVVVLSLHTDSLYLLAGIVLTLSSPAIWVHVVASLLDKKITGSMIENIPANKNVQMVMRFYNEMWNQFDRCLFLELLAKDVRFPG